MRNVVRPALGVILILCLLFSFSTAVTFKEFWKDSVGKTSVGQLYNGGAEEIFISSCEILTCGRKDCSTQYKCGDDINKDDVWTIAHGDVDSDGNMDFVLGNSTHVSIYECEGTVCGIGYSDTLMYNAKPISIAIGDVDNDDKNELMVGTSGAKEKGAGAFSNPPFYFPGEKKWALLLKYKCSTEDSCDYSEYEFFEPITNIAIGDATNNGDNELLIKGKVITCEDYDRMSNCQDMGNDDLSPLVVAKANEKDFKGDIAITGKIINTTHNQIISAEEGIVHIYSCVAGQETCYEHGNVSLDSNVRALGKGDIDNDGVEDILFSVGRNIYQLTYNETAFAYSLVYTADANVDSIDVADLFDNNKNEIIFLAGADIVIIKPVADNGESCEASADCNSTFCVNNICTSGLDGSVCTDNNDCVSENCGGSVCCAQGHTCCANSTMCSYGKCDTSNFTCVKLENGEDCLSNEDCNSANCVNDVCCELDKTCCKDDAHCPFGRCNSEIFYCGKLGFGQLCEKNEDCTTDICLNSVCCRKDVSCCLNHTDCPENQYCSKNECIDVAPLVKLDKPVNSTLTAPTYFSFGVKTEQAIFKNSTPWKYTCNLTQNRKYQFTMKSAPSGPAVNVSENNFYSITSPSNKTLYFSDSNWTLKEDIYVYEFPCNETGNWTLSLAAHTNQSDWVYNLDDIGILVEAVPTPTPTSAPEAKVENTTPNVTVSKITAEEATPVATEAVKPPTVPPVTLAPETVTENASVSVTPVPPPKKGRSTAMTLLYYLMGLGILFAIAFIFTPFKYIAAPYLLRLCENTDTTLLNLVPDESVFTSDPTPGAVDKIKRKIYLIHRDTLNPKMFTPAQEKLTTIVQEGETRKEEAKKKKATAAASKKNLPTVKRIVKVGPDGKKRVVKVVKKVKKKGETTAVPQETVAPAVEEVVEAVAPEPTPQAAYPQQYAQDSTYGRVTQTAQHDSQLDEGQLVGKLRTLKTLVDEGLISVEDYNKKKSEFLERFH